MTGLVTQTDWWIAVPTALNALCAVVTVVATVRLVSETSRQRAAITEPHVIVFARPAADAPTLFEIVIKNVGPGTARNINFRLSRPVPYRAWGVDPDQAPAAEPMRSGPLIDGIEVLPPGEQRTLIWGQLGGLKKALDGSRIHVTAYYDDLNGNEPRATVSVLEIDSYDGFRLVDPDGTRKTAKAIKELADAVGRLERGWSNLRVTIEPPSSEGISAPHDDGPEGKQ